MASSELSTPKNNIENKSIKMTNKTTVSQEIHKHIDTATDLLLLRDFKNCQASCLNGISLAKRNIELESSIEGIESLCVLCIQALAEMNKWSEVLPLVNSIYTGIETCPASVIQLCILLHAKVKEFPQCHAIASIWLRCTDNSSQTDYTEVVSLYTKHVMVPQGQVDTIPQFLDTYTTLEQNTKQKIVSECENLKLLQEQKELDKCSKDESNNAETDNTDIDEQDTTVHKEEDPPIVRWAKYLASQMASSLVWPSLKLLFKIAMVAVSFCILVKVAYLGDPMLPNIRMSELWQTGVSIFKSVFSPYKPGR